MEGGKVSLVLNLNKFTKLFYYLYNYFETILHMRILTNNLSEA